MGLLKFSKERQVDFYTTALSSESGRFPLISSRDTRSYFTGLVYYSRKHKKQSRNVYFPYEQTVLLETKNTTKKSHYVGNYFRSDMYLAFPGINTTHSLRGKFRYETQSDKDYRFRRNINFVNGYDGDFLFNEFIGWGVEYELPIIYPDLEVGPLINFKRVRVTGFINGGRISNSNPTPFTEKPISFGSEINFDVNFFRQPSEFNIGIRYSYIKNTTLEKNNVIELIIGSIVF